LSTVAAPSRYQSSERAERVLRPPEYLDEAPEDILHGAVHSVCAFVEHEPARKECPLVVSSDDFAKIGKRRDLRIIHLTAFAADREWSDMLPCDGIGR
jgi:hypothetical protein